MTANTHLEHLEDYVLTDLPMCLQILSDIASNMNSVNVGIKYDGSPAIVFGTDPVSGKFFIGTKSVFNKTPKINFCAKDIIENHSKSKGLLDKLLVVFAYLESIKTSFPKIYQADLMYTSADIEYTEHKNPWDDAVKEELSFTANTITYKITDRVLLHKILDSKLGIAIHTTYDSLADPVPTFGHTGIELHGDVVTLPVKAACTYLFDNNNHISNLCDDIDLDVYAEFTSSIYPALFKIYDNHILRTTEKQIDHWCNGHSFKLEGFLNWLVARRTDDIQRLSTAKGKLTHLTKMQNDITFLTRTDICLMMDKLVTVRSEVIRKKLSLLRTLENAQQDIMTMHIAYTRVGHEGYVFSTSDWRVKMVDREVFSRCNFLVDATKCK